MDVVRTGYSLFSQSYSLGVVARDLLLDLLFPQWCVGCEREGTLLCDPCRGVFPQLTIAPTCPICARLAPGTFFCLSCTKRSGLRRLWCIGSFAERLLRESIHTLKYNGAQELAWPLGEELGRRITCSYTGPSLLVVPVPLHWRRHNARGFNQSERIAHALCSVVDGVVVRDLLRRARLRAPQVEVKHTERAKNVRGVFRLHTSALELRHSPVLLVDDVWTTGSTMREAARVLTEAGFQQIYGAVVARG